MRQNAANKKSAEIQSAGGVLEAIFVKPLAQKFSKYFGIV